VWDIKNSKAKEGFRRGPYLYQAFELLVRLSEFLSLSHPQFYSRLEVRAIKYVFNILESK